MARTASVLTSTEIAAVAALAALSANRAVVTDGSSLVVSATTTATQIGYLSGATGVTGTGSIVFSASPTFTGVITAVNETLSGQLSVTGDIAIGTASANGYIQHSDASGLVLQGAGSANDMTFVNSAGSNVFRIVTGSTTVRFYGTVEPSTSDAAVLGSTSRMWSDLFLASGAVINFNAGNYTVTHSAGSLAFSGALSVVGTTALQDTVTLTSQKKIVSSASTFNSLDLNDASGNVFLASRGSVYLDVDSDDTSTANVLWVRFNAANATPTVTGIFQENGAFTLGSTAGAGTGAFYSAAQTITVASAASTAETLATYSVSDDATGRMYIENSSTTDASFVPQLRGVTGGTTRGMTIVGQGTTDTGALSLLEFRARIGTTTAVSTRPLFTWTNHTTIRAVMAANGDLTLGTAAGTAVSDIYAYNGNYASTLSCASTLTVGAQATATSVGIELGNHSGGTPFIDFKSSAVDYDVRIINSAANTLSFVGASAGYYFDAAINSIYAVVATSASATLTTLTQGITVAGNLVTSTYVSDGYTAGLTWSSTDDNASRPKAGIFSKTTASGSYIFFGTSDAYATGITNTVSIDPYGSVAANRFSANSTSTTQAVVSLQGDSLTTGYLLNATSGSTSASTRDLVYINNSSSSATATTVLHIKQDANYLGLYSESASTTVYSNVLVGNSHTTGGLLLLQSNSSSASARTIVSYEQLNASATAAIVMNLYQAASGTSFYINQSAVNDGNKCYGLQMNISNAGAGLEYAFRFDGAEIVSAAVGGSQNKKIRISIAGTDYFIPCNTA